MSYLVAALLGGVAFVVIGANMNMSSAGTGGDTQANFITGAAIGLIVQTGLRMTGVS